MDFGNNVLPWTRHIRAGRDLVHRAFEAANKMGDLNCAASCCNQLNTNLLGAGDPLAETQREAELGLTFARKARYGTVIDAIATQLGLIRTLRGLTETFGSFDDEQFDERRIERRFSENSDLAFVECWYWVRKLQARFFAGDYASAIEASSRAQRLLWTSASQFETAEFRFYGALSQAASADSASPDRRRQHVEALAAHHSQLEIWAANCPDNFENRAALVGAEIARLKGRELDAERLYEQAIRSARANGFIHNEALANELASRFYAARGFEKIARVYLQDARYGFLRWGAHGKVRQLEETYPHLRAEEPAPGPTSTIATPVERLDLATVIQVSQAVSGEMVLEKLINMLMRTAIAQVGAQRGLLILSRGAEPRIEAQAMTIGDTVSVELRDEPVTAATLPETVLHYILRTLESVVLDDAATEPSFGADPYIRQRQARSILCLPLINQSKLIGVLYLENNLTPRAFAPARVGVLKLLASQAAISLENARLYRDLEQREAKIRGLVDANIIGICVAARDGRMIEANDAFLRMVGYDREDLLSGLMSWMDLTPPEWRDRSAQAFSKAAMTGAAQPFEKEYFRRDGSRVPVLVGVAGIEGTEHQTLSFVLDLTERKQAERAAYEREAKIRGLFDANIVGIFIANRESQVIEANDAFLHTLGYDREDLIAGRINRASLTPPEWLHRHVRMLAEQNTFGIAQTFEKEYFKKDGSRVPVLIGAAMLERDRVVAFVLDLSERKRAEAEARDSERRYAAVQAELAHANRVATMGQLTASIAHEVNQPIAAAVTNAQAGLRWLSAEPPSIEGARRTLGNILENGNRAGEVIGRIRALVKKAPPRKDGVAINDAILEVVALTHGEAVKNGVAVRTQLAEGLSIIEGDRVQLQQVILNLIVNAIEAMSGTNEAPLDLLLSTEKSEPDGVLVAVRDSGPGLAPENLERLFDAFYTTKANGMGMGLSICRSIVEAQGGRLWASANEPRGAVFQFTLPAHPEQGEEAEASSSTGS
jgi:PAS domain S-box-containing protein